MKEHANTLVTHFGVDHPDLIYTIYKLVDLKSVFSIIQIGNKTKTLKNKWKYKILKNKLKQKQPPYSNILFSRYIYIYIYKKLKKNKMSKKGRTEGYKIGYFCDILEIPE